jgi:hypothetical protein
MNWINIFLPVFAPYQVLLFLDEDHEEGRIVSDYGLFLLRPENHEHLTKILDQQ